MKALSNLCAKPLYALALILASCASTPSNPTYDLVFDGGRVVDGTGAPWFAADVGVIGDRIAAVGNLDGARAKRRIDATGLVVAPGFIDMLGQSEYLILVDGRAASKITQGITTEITGEGSSIAPTSARMIAEGNDTWEHYGVKPDWTDLAGYWRAFARASPALNMATFVGAGGVRELVIGRDDRPATREELKEMERLVEEAMVQGALGLSTSLLYVPDRFASTEEIIALARVAARHGGSYITHQRDEGDGIDESLDEVFRIAHEAEIPTEIYHLKTAGKKNWGRMPAILRRIEEARASGLDVMADQYPWDASSNSLHASLPIWARAGTREEMVARLADPEVRARVRAEMADPDAEWSAGELAPRILITSAMSSELGDVEGKTLEAVAKARGVDPIDALMDIVVADRGHTGRVTFSMSDDDVRAALRHPFVSMCTDSGARAEDGILSQEAAHPRAWGSTGRLLGHYVRDEGVLSLEEAVRKMTSLPAARMGLTDRGILRPGMNADLAVFDPRTVSSRSTYTDSQHYCEGIPYVVVNGQLVVEEGRITDARPGRPVYGPGYTR